jgi:hypothetical protein
LLTQAERLLGCDDSAALTEYQSLFLVIFSTQARPEGTVVPALLLSRTYTATIVASFMEAALAFAAMARDHTRGEEVEELCARFRKEHEVVHTHVCNITMTHSSYIKVTPK